MNFLRSAVYRIIYTVVMFIAGLVISNIALPDKFGTISLLIVNAYIFSLVTGLGSDSMVMHQLSNNKWSVSQASHFTGRTVLLQLALFALFEGLCLFFWNRTLFSYQPSGYVFIDVVYFIGLILAEKYLTLLYSIHKAVIANGMLIITGLIYLVILFVFNYYLKIDFYTLLWVFGIQSLLQGFVLFLLFHFINKKEPLQKLVSKEISLAYKISSIVMITNVVQLLAYRMDFWILKIFHSNFDIGVYALANKFANLIWIIPNIFAQLLIPKFFAIKTENIPVVFRSAFYSNIIIVAVTIICTYFFYAFYLDIEYRPGFDAFFLMLPGYFFWGSVIYFGAYISWMGRFTYNLFCSIVCCLLIFLADIFLIPKYSIHGAALANTIVYTFVFLIYVLIMKYKLSFSLRQLFIPHKRDFVFISKFFRR